MTNEPEEWIELESPSNGGCRTCCSTPHGSVSVMTSLVATLAWVFGMIATNGCDFLQPNNPGFTYCHPAKDPEPRYGSCGDCHCINGDKPCPTDPQKIPLTEVDDDWLKQLQAMDATNPYKMICNPYNTSGAIQSGTCTDPPQKEYQLELWETAVCGIIYDMESLEEETQCPTKYRMETFDSEEEMLAAGAEMTHWGACGACSTTKDLAVYLEYPDLTGKGQECSVRALAKGFAEGVSCFQEVGYTYDCAVMWQHNVFNTRDSCFGTCAEFTFLGDGANNGPAPSCKLADCLNCDEQMSGPGFQTVAARSRRRSGLLSKIVRDCDNLLIVDHKRPCEVTKAKLAEERQTNRNLQGKQSSERLEQPAQYHPPKPTETCYYVGNYMGLGGYESTEEGNTLFSLMFGNERYDSLYVSCFRYDFNSVMAGFWKNYKDTLGKSYGAALAFAIIASILGGITCIFSWCSMCVVYRADLWTRFAVIYLVCSLCMFLTMVFFSSDVCKDTGCTIGTAGIFAIVSGFTWIIAAGLALKSKLMDKSIPKASCCCCPVVIEGRGAYSAVPLVHGDDETTNVIVQESADGDGSKVVTKITVYPDGSKATERTVYKKDKKADVVEQAKPVADAVAGE